MAVDIIIDQIRLQQLIATGTYTPGKLIVISDKTDGTSNFSGTINDVDFLAQAAASDTFFIVSGSKFNAREPNSIGGNNGVVLFTGDVVMSASLIVATDQISNYKPIQAISSSFFGNEDIVLGSDNGLAINRSMFAANSGITTITNDINSSVVFGSYNAQIFGSQFGGMIGSGNSTIVNSTASMIFNSSAGGISNGAFVSTINGISTDTSNCSYFVSINEQNTFQLSCINVFSANNNLPNYESTQNFLALGNYTLNVYGVGDSTYPTIAIGNSSAEVNYCSRSFAIGSKNTIVNSSNCGVFYTDYIEIPVGVTNSYAMFVNAPSLTTLNVSNRILFGGSSHQTYLSGSLRVNSGISGSHNYLADGSTLAYTMFSTNSGPTHIITSSNGQVNFGSLTRIGMGNYVSSTATSSIPEIAGTAYINSYEHEDVMNISGAYAKFRCILSTATSSNTAFVKLWNVSDNGYVQIGGTGVYSLSTTSSTPVALVSNNLTDATLGLSMSNKVYEVHIYISGAGLPAIVNHHKSELLFAPRTLSGYS